MNETTWTTLEEKSNDYTTVKLTEAKSKDFICYQVVYTVFDSLEVHTYKTLKGAKNKYNYFSVN